MLSINAILTVNPSLGLYAPIVSVDRNTPIKTLARRFLIVMEK